MDRRIMLLLASLMLVFSLAACGSDRTAGDMDQNGTVSGGSAAGDASSGNGTGSDANGASGGSSASGGSGGVLGGNGSAGTASGGDTATGGTAGTTSGRIGASYDQMVRNGRVHDRDGDLTDFENAVTPGSIF